MKNQYVCICGKAFNNPQQFNAHKSHCKEHYMNKYGNLELYTNFHSQRNKKISKGVSDKLKEEKELKYKQWISEQHKCESCGKIMTEYFGSGRFCSRKCANSRKHSDKSKEQTSKTLIKLNNPILSESDIHKKYLKNKQRKEQRKKKFIYTGQKLPNLQKDSLKAGYQNRHRMPYSEQFWKKVLDNNNINYKLNVSVWKPGHNNYWLDFLIDDVIDLEIDGELHNTPEVIIKDNIRNNYLQSLGYIIYRIKWINPVSDKNKEIVNKQIEDLMNFLNKPRIQ